MTAGTALIRRSVASVGGGTVVKDTKTHAARRIALDPETLAALQRRRKRAEAQARACRCELDPGVFVFSAAPDGSAPLHLDTVTTSFQRPCRRLVDEHVASMGALARITASAEPSSRGGSPHGAFRHQMPRIARRAPPPGAPTGSDRHASGRQSDSISFSTRSSRLLNGSLHSTVR
jgi:hypothetical protein